MRFEPGSSHTAVRRPTTKPPRPTLHRAQCTPCIALERPSRLSQLDFTSFFFLTFHSAGHVFDLANAANTQRLTLFLNGVCMSCECIYGECAHEQHVRRTLTLTLTLTHMITAYSVSGNVVRMRILICATRQKPCRKRVYHIQQAEYLVQLSHIRTTGKNPGYVYASSIEISLCRMQTFVPHQLT